MGSESFNASGNIRKQARGETERPCSDEAESASFCTGESMTAAALLWGRAPMTRAAAPTVSSSSSSTSSSASSFSTGNPNKEKTAHTNENAKSNANANSPASNAAAALLVGMSMRNDREGKQKTAEEYLIGGMMIGNPASIGTTADQKAFDVEEKWQIIRLQISQETLESVISSGKEEEDKADGECKLDLPKGVTRRPSGAWQAQIYFAGKTRYIGVWEKACQAAVAYNKAKEAVKELKKEQQRQQKNNSQHRSKRKSLGAEPWAGPAPKMTRTSMLATPRRDPKSVLPPSITWPSSASSSSTNSSSCEFRSPALRGPLKKRCGFDHREQPPENEAAQKQQQQQASLPQPQRDHLYSAFSQQFHHPQQQQQQQQQQHASRGIVPMTRGKSPLGLTHPALQLLSLRPPQQAPVWMHSNPPPQPLQPYHPSQTYHPGLYHFNHDAPHPRPSNEDTTNGAHQTSASSSSSSAAPLKGKSGKKAAKGKASKTSLNNRKKKKAATKDTGKKQPLKDCARDAENAKWRAIRAEVLCTLPKGGGGGVQKDQRTFDKDVLRGITVRPSGKFQAQLYYGGRSRYIGVFNSEFEAASAYEMIRSRLKDGGPLSSPTLLPSKSSPSPSPSSSLSPPLPLITSSARVDTNGDTAEAAGQKTAETSTAAMRSITPSPTPGGSSGGGVSAAILSKGFEEVKVKKESRSSQWTKYVNNNALGIKSENKGE